MRGFSIDILDKYNAKITIGGIKVVSEKISVELNEVVNDEKYQGLINALSAIFKDFTEKLELL